MVQFSIINKILDRNTEGLKAIEYNYDLLLGLISNCTPVCDSDRLLMDSLTTLKKRTDNKDKLVFDLELQKIILDWYTI